MGALRDIVGSLSKLDAEAGAMNFEITLSLLQRLLEQTSFQSQSAEAPVQVLGLLEVTGLSFDAVWICSMDNQKWPLCGSPNSYLPLAWQRVVGAPHASPERELKFTRYTMSELKRIASEVIFSHVSRRDDNGLRCAYELADVPEIKSRTWYAENTIPETAKLQRLQDHFGPAVAEGEHVRGGSGLLTAQAGCPFSAFVGYRLLTEGLETPGMNVDPRVRGVLIHDLLELFWKQTKNQETLIAKSDEELRQCLDTLADEVMKKFQGLPRLGKLEKNRMLNIAGRWLELEKQRQSFINESTEELRELDFNGIDIRMKIDRIDTVLNDDGSQSRVIIDYKSGSSSQPGSWMEERPGEPQLPIYAITDEHAVSGIAYAILTSRDLCFRGFAERDDLLPKVGLPQKPNVDKPGGKKQSVNWDNAIAGWKDAIGALALEVRDGLASVTPKKNACQYCPLPPVCRIADSMDVEITDDTDGEST